MLDAAPGRRSAAGLPRLRPTVGAPIVALVLAGTAALVLIAAFGLHDWAQRSVNGLIAGTYFALGAVGLTLIYGTLKLVNFAHGDLLTFGAYAAFAVTTWLGVPFVVALCLGTAVTGLLALGTERVMWRPMRAKRAGLLQLMLMSLGLAFVIRYGIQLAAGTEPRTLGVDVTSSVGFAGLRLGRTELIVAAVGIGVLVAVGALLRATSLGRQVRALADNLELAQVAGIDTGRVVTVTWLIAGALAGLAGVLYAAAVGSMTPNLGFFLLLSLFAAVVLGGVGSAYGALVGGLVIGLAQEWSTLVVDARWKLLAGFAILVGTLLVRPQGLFGRRERTL
jgi:neutral amino acid transport system permease protein